jgi:hypothetical protein
MIGGNAVVNAKARCGIGIGTNWEPGTLISGFNIAPVSTAVLVIYDNAQVNAQGNEGAGIGGEFSTVGFSNGTVIVEGNAVVRASTGSASAAIGGGIGSYAGGGGGIITIGGNARVTARSYAGTAIGGGRGGQNGPTGGAGTVTIKDNAFVTAVGGHAIGSYGIGKAPNHPFFSMVLVHTDIRILGGTVNAATIGGSYVPIQANVITGGSVYTGGSAANDPLSVYPNYRYRVKLTVQDEEGNKLDNIRLRLDGNYELETGRNLVWGDRKYDEDTQPGVAYAWLSTGMRNVEISGYSGNFTPQSIDIRPNNNNEYVITLNLGVPAESTWTAANGTSDWNDAGNWSNGKPGGSTIVTISGNATHFPILTGTVEVGEIHFEQGAQIKGQHHIQGNAFVQYDFSEEASRDRWLMLSMPLGEAYAGDFTFGNYPTAWVRTFRSSETIKEGNVVTQGTWVTARQSNVPFTYGDGFVLWLNKDNTSVEKGLKLLGGIHEIPFFHHQAAEAGSAERILLDKAHYHHEYDGNGQSTFFNSVQIDGEYVRGPISYPVSRSNAAFGLAGESVTKVLSFGENEEAGGEVALVGNPFMAALDFDALASSGNNSGAIKPVYHIWTGDAYETYTADGDAGVTGGVTLSQYIAPLQAFIVEKAESPANSVLSFYAPTMTTVGENSGLRSSSSSDSKLDIVARNPVAAVRTFIANREGGQDEFGNRDARKIMSGIGNIPEVYTLKPYKGGSIATAINIINNDEQLIPLGFSDKLQRRHHAHVQRNG